MSSTANYLFNFIIFALITGCIGNCDRITKSPSTSSRLSYPDGQRTFSVDYKRNLFLKDGQPYQYISGEIHYFRIHSSLWDDRLMRVRQAGLNAVQVYIPWNYHEEEQGKFDFSGERDLAEFLRVAQRNELDVLLRIGPYVCAEWEFGGLPWWLGKEPGIRLRSSDPKYLAHVKRYFDVLLPILRPLLHKNGGPILMLQIENEYGSVLCDKKYLRWLRDEVRAHLGQETVLYTTDGFSDQMLRCGSIEGTLTTVDFGVTSDKNVQEFFERQQNYSKGGPKVNSEFYTTWFSMWGDKGPVRQDPIGVIRTLKEIYRQNASVSLYMVHGGSNFGFWNGAETDGPVLSSYDYSAPISEEGQITPLYIKIREWIKSLPGWPNPPSDLPRNRTGVTVDNVKAARFGGLLSVAKRLIDEGKCHRAQHPVSFEQLDEFYNYVLYSNLLTVGGNLISIPELRDYAYVYTDGVYQGSLSLRGDYGYNRTLKLKTPAKAGQRLEFIVESYGRLTYPIREDTIYKGILSNVELDKQVIKGEWTHCGIDFEKVPALVKTDTKTKGTLDTRKSAIAPYEYGKEEKSGPAVYTAEFDSKNIDWKELHTFFDSTGWGKGFLLVNGFNIGRYWPVRGPEMTLFAPGAIFNSNATNTLILVDLLDIHPNDNRINFISEPKYNFSGKISHDNSGPGGIDVDSTEWENGQRASVLTSGGNATIAN